MKNVKMLTSRSYNDYLIASLRDPEEAAAYIEAILEEKNPEPELLRSGLQEVAQALGQLTMPIEQANHHLEQLDQILPDHESQVIYNLANWLSTLGLKLSVTNSSSVATMKYTVDPESIQAYRMRVFTLSQELQRETNPSSRAMTALYLAEAATTLARMEVLEVSKALGAESQELRI